ncbi:MAG: cytochrome P460 family protein [Pseudomonadota bacterium]
MPQNSSAQSDIESAHIAIENPANLSQDQANAVYDSLKEQMAAGYAPAAYQKAKDYLSWKRYNSAPYISPTHGQRFVNNYANDKAADYGKLQPGTTYPPGAIFAKDTLTITDEDRKFPGALFVMEKLEAGESAETADWRYVMILPDGTVFGDTMGVEPAQVEYCHACHKAKAKDDYVFFVPKDFITPQ